MENSFSDKNLSYFVDQMSEESFEEEDNPECIGRGEALQL